MESIEKKEYQARKPDESYNRFNAIEKEIHSLQMIAIDKTKKIISEEEIEAAIDNLNPDENSMESRG